jgi:hypothetical protein
VKPQDKKKLQAITQPTTIGEDGKLIDPKTQLVKGIEGVKEYMSDSKGG